jgi:hypothetical protein
MRARKAKLRTYPSILRPNTILQRERDERRNVTCLGLLVPQCVQYQYAKFVLRRNGVVGDKILDVLYKTSLIQRRSVPSGRTFISAPALVARPCSTSPNSKSLSLSTSRLSSPTSATCLLTFPPSFLNSGYSSTKCFISVIELIEDGCCARERAWYDWTYDLRPVPRSPKVAR